MKVSPLDNTSVQNPAVQLARLSGPHGYRFDGDTVHLNAMFALLNPAAHDCSWALQLWACDRSPESAADLTGHIVAEVSLPPMAELADETEHFEVCAFASPPCGAGEYVMVLVLASGRPGQFNQIQDLAVYPCSEEFAQPRMIGRVSYRLDGARVHIAVDRVENPRPETNRSGTLSLELWALSEPFTGGRFQGHHLAGVEIGSVNGQSEFDPQAIDLAFNPPPAGNWQIVLMLREWTANGFVTRDFTNFATRFISAPVVEKAPAQAPVAAKPSALIAEKSSVSTIEKPAAPVVEKAPAPAIAKPSAPIAEKTTISTIEKSTAPVAAQAAALTVAPVAAKAPAPTVAPVAAKAPAQEAPKASAAAPAKPAADASPKPVSVNTARFEELAAVKGLSPKLAECIVKKRPFSSLDDLRKVKGLGTKILAEVRSRLRL